MTGGGVAFTLGGGQATMVFLVMLRCTGLVFTAPIFGHHTLPALLKFGLAAGGSSPSSSAFRSAPSSAPRSRNPRPPSIPSSPSSPG
jgi:flagellar biosynthesis protein FliR